MQQAAQETRKGPKSALP
ncbi:hypothetical protein pipiens_000378 [Culex pipiens pipiens]|uniref:Uncharacterized protein n=1 Tax=Culex pipiens pipiens TaxID=38569 RepID=A0ABD1D2L2_CULPP